MISVSRAPVASVCMALPDTSCHYQQIASDQRARWSADCGLRSTGIVPICGHAPDRFVWKRYLLTRIQQSSASGGNLSSRSSGRYTCCEACFLSRALRESRRNNIVTTNDYTRSTVDTERLRPERALFNVEWLYWTVQCFTSPPTQYRLYGDGFYGSKKPNQQYQSTEGKSTKKKIRLHTQ